MFCDKILSQIIKEDINSTLDTNLIYIFFKNTYFFERKLPLHLSPK